MKPDRGDEGMTWFHRFVSWPDKKPWLARLFLVLAVALVYANSFRGPLVLDDLPTLLNNPSLRSLTSPASVLWPTGGPTSGRPLLNLSFAFDHAGGTGAVARYHATNLLIHLAAVCLVFSWMRRALRLLRMEGVNGREAAALAFCIALAWGVHPVATASVTYISQRAESLMALCYLATLYCLLRAIEAPEARRWPVLAVTACAAGMATKEVMVTAPLAALLLDWTLSAGSLREVWGRRRGLYIGLAATWVLLAGLMVASGIQQRGVGTGTHFTAWSYACTQCTVVVRYIGLVVWPWPLTFDYGVDPVAPSTTAVALCAGALMLLVSAALWAAVKRLPAGFAGLWFFLLLAPTSTIVAVEHQPMAENRLYLPLLPALVCGMLFVRRVGGVRALPLLALPALAFLAHARNADYATAQRLWADTVAKRPQNARAWQHYGGALQEAGRRQEALVAFGTAARLRPESAEHQLNIGMALLGEPDRYEEALAHFRAAVRLQSQLPAAHLQLGAALMRKPATMEEGRAQLAAAEKLASRDPGVLTQIGRILANLPAYAPEAAGYFQRALALDPDFPAAHFALGLSLASQPGRDRETENHYWAALRGNPDLVIVHNNLGAILAARSGALPEAIGHFEAAVRLDAKYAEARINLAQALTLQPGRTAEAIEYYRAGLRLNPDSARGQLGLGRLLLQTGGSREEAIACLEAAARLEPSWTEPRHLLEQARAARR